ncbi:hypothetical protein KKE75_05020 [Patescibacteria group bacterium]|nr:hypothetical protein [Patescibacteria group bacterium]
MSKELEGLTAQAQMDAINAAMMKLVVQVCGERIIEEGKIPEPASLEIVNDMMLIAAQVDQHFQKQGSLEDLRVQVGFWHESNNEAFSMRNSLVKVLIDPKVELASLNTKADLERLPSSIEGLEILRDRQGDYYRYFLADKRPNWTEAG